MIPWVTVFYRNNKHQKCCLDSLNVTIILTLLTQFDFESLLLHYITSIIPILLCNIISKLLLSCIHCMIKNLRQIKKFYLLTYVGLLSDNNKNLGEYFFFF